MANRVATSLSLSLSLLFLFFFFFAFSLSHARDINDPLPKPEPEFASEIDREPASTPVSNSKPQQHDTVSFTVDSVDPVPLTLVSLRPIGRHIPPRHQLPLPLPLSLRFGHGHRRCRHGRRREISYGNDMIVRSSPGVAPVDRTIIPARWVKIRHGEPRVSEIPRIDRRFDHHEEHRHHHHHHHGEEEKHGAGWFVKKIRKFLNLF